MTSVLPSICIIIPYFGRWPLWIEYFLESCKANSDIDWLIYTDCGMPNNCPSNVRLVEIEFQDYCFRLSQSLDIQFEAYNPYKLCDVKPALGWIHAEELKGYDFWGFGDIDLLYGDLRKYFTAERLAKFDIFSTHARRISGHLCVVRNTEEMRKAFMRVSHWRSILTSVEHKAFDESAFSKIFLRHKNSPHWVRYIAKIFDPWLRRAEFVEAYTTPNGKISWLDGSYHFPSKWYWQKGVISNDFNEDRNIPYFHFMIWKRQWLAKNIDRYRPLELDEKVEITANGLCIMEEG